MKGKRIAQCQTSGEDNKSYRLVLIVIDTKFCI